MKRQKGFSLLEFSIVLAVVLFIGGLVAAAGSFYRDSSRSSDFRSHLLSVKAGLSATAKRGGSSGPQNHASVARAGGVPERQLVSAAALSSSSSAPGRSAAIAAAGAKVLRHPYGGLTSASLPALGGAGGLALAGISAFDLTPEDCVTAVTVAWDAFDRITINSSAPVKDRFVTPAHTIANPAAIEAECASRPNSTVRYEFAP